MPIIRHGYATNRRNGSTRAHRKERALVLAFATKCHACGQPPRDDDPLEAGHVNPYAYHGDGPLEAVHRSCNRRLGALPMKGGVA